MFITHDFGVVAEIADRVAVMQQGAVVEIGPADDVLNAPRHPYTQKLIAAVPQLTPRKRRRMFGHAAADGATICVKTFKTGGGLVRAGSGSSRRSKMST